MILFIIPILNINQSFTFRRYLRYSFVISVLATSVIMERTSRKSGLSKLLITCQYLCCKQFPKYCDICKDFRLEILAIYCRYIQPEFVTGSLEDVYKLNTRKGSLWSLSWNCGLSHERKQISLREKWNRVSTYRSYEPTERRSLSAIFFFSKSKRCFRPSEDSPSAISKINTAISNPML